MSEFQEIKNRKKKKAGITRRDFFKISAAAGAGGGVASLIDWAVVGPNPALGGATNYDTITTCPYCSVGCNMKVGVDGTAVKDIIGDPDCPINKGALCSKGAAAIQLVNNPRRVGVPDSVHTVSRPNGTTQEGPMVRVGNNPWEGLTWDEAFSGKAGHSNPSVVKGIAQLMKDAREATTGWTSGGKVIGQARGVAFLGCSHATNEENWLYRKLIANFGTNNIEHQARI